MYICPPDRGINLHLKHRALCNSGLGHSGCDALHHSISGATGGPFLFSPLIP